MVLNLLRTSNSQFSSAQLCRGCLDGSVHGVALATDILFISISDVNAVWFICLSVLLSCLANKRVQNVEKERQKCCFVAWMF